MSVQSWWPWIRSLRPAARRRRHGPSTEAWRQVHRFLLFQVTWLITGVLAAFVGWLAKVDDGTDLGGFGEALGGMLDGWAVIVAMCVPLTAAVILRLVGRLTTGGLSRELRRDAGEIANDAIGVIHNTLSFAASCLGVLAVLDVQNRRWGFAVTALCAETYAITCCAMVSLVVTIWDDVVTATSLALRRWARRAR